MTYAAQSRARHEASLKQDAYELMAEAEQNQRVDSRDHPFLAMASNKGWITEPDRRHNLKIILNPPDDSWWPKIGEGKQSRHCTHLYRVLRPDMKDMNRVARRNMDKWEDLARLIVKGLGYGSKENVTSAFWHCSKSQGVAANWQARAGSWGNEGPPPGFGNIAIKLDIWQWFADGEMPPGAIIDLSDGPAQKRFFNKPDEEFSMSNSFFRVAMENATKQKEVLVCWRGEVPLKYCTVVDLNSGIEVGPLQPLLDHARASNGSLVKQIGEPKYCDKDPQNVFLPADEPHNKATEEPIQMQRKPSPTQKKAPAPKRKLTDRIHTEEHTQATEEPQAQVQRTTSPTPKKAPAPKMKLPDKLQTEEGFILAQRPTRNDVFLATPHATVTITPSENKSHCKAAADASHTRGIHIVNGNVHTEIGHLYRFDTKDPEPSENKAVEADNASLDQKGACKRNRTSSPKPATLPLTRVVNAQNEHVPIVPDAVIDSDAQKGSDKRLKLESREQRSRKQSTGIVPPQHEPIVLDLLPTDEAPDYFEVESYQARYPPVPVFHAPREASSSASSQPAYQPSIPKRSHNVIKTSRNESPSQPDSSTPPSLAQPDVQSEQESLEPEQWMALVEAVNMRKMKQIRLLKATYSSAKFEIIGKVHALEIEYDKNMSELTERVYKSHKDDLHKHDLSTVIDSNTSNNGFRKPIHNDQRLLTQELRSDKHFTYFRRSSQELLETHGKSLIDLGMAKVLELLPGSTLTKRAVDAALAKWPPPSRHNKCSQPLDLGTAKKAVYYLPILRDLGLMEVRKCERTGIVVIVNLVLQYSKYSTIQYSIYFATILVNTVGLRLFMITVFFCLCFVVRLFSQS